MLEIRAEQAADAEADLVEALQEGRAVEHILFSPVGIDSPRG